MQVNSTLPIDQVFADRNHSKSDVAEIETERVGEILDNLDDDANKHHRGNVIWSSQEKDLLAQKLWALRSSDVTSTLTQLLHKAMEVLPPERRRRSINSVQQVPWLPAAIRQIDREKSATVELLNKEIAELNDAIQQVNETNNSLMEQLEIVMSSSTDLSKASASELLAAFIAKTEAAAEERMVAQWQTLSAQLSENLLQNLQPMLSERHRPITNVVNVNNTNTVKEARPKLLNVLIVGGSPEEFKATLTALLKNGQKASYNHLKVEKPLDEAAVPKSDVAIILARRVNHLASVKRAVTKRIGPENVLIHSNGIGAIPKAAGNLIPSHN